jgi:putative DNA primase/helicase
MGKDETTANLNEEEILAALAGTGSNASVDPTQFRRTDAGNADLLVAMFGQDLRYVEKWSAWRVWNGARWIEASDLMLIPFARAATEHMFHWAETLPNEEKNALRKHAFTSQKRDRLVAMIYLLKGYPQVRAAPGLFDADPMLLGCNGSTIDLRNGQLYVPKRKHYITKSTGIAVDKSAKCPNWLAYLNWVFNGDQETIKHLQRIAGYMLTGDVSEEKLFAFFGGGGNGKTTVVMTLYELLGEYAGKARSDLLLQSQGEKGAASPDLAALQGKRLVVVSETDDHSSIAEAQVKGISSNEPVPARKLYGDVFTFKSTHKILLMTNHPPFIKGTDDAIWRRLNILPFNAKVTEQAKDVHFRERNLLPELPGILAWAIRGCFAWQKEGLKPSAAVKTATNAYRTEMDFLANWLEERSVCDAKSSIPRSEAYGDYKNWAQSEGAPILGNRRFFLELKTRGFQSGKSHGVRLVGGMRLKRGLPPCLIDVAATQ